MSMTFTDTTGAQVGHWVLDVYEGEVQRERLPLWKQTVNTVWRLGHKGLPKYLGDPIGEPIHTMEGHNLVVTVGKNIILDRLFGLSGVSAMSRIGVGTSSTAAAVGNTTLTGSSFKAYDATPTRSSQTVTCITTFGTSDANLSWNELGMDNGTTLLNRIAPIGPFNKTSAVSIIVRVTFTQN